MFCSLFLFSFFAVAFGLPGLSQPLQPRATDDQFNIYAFGDGIDGLQVYYINSDSPFLPSLYSTCCNHLFSLLLDIAAIGDPAKTSLNASIPVHCMYLPELHLTSTLANEAFDCIIVTVSESAAYTWIATPQSSNSSWSTKLLYMGDDTANEVGFTAPTNTTGKMVNKWWRYGQYVMTEVSGANFYAEAMSGFSGWYALSWSTSDQTAAGKTLLTLRTIAPSTDSVLS
jgi:hypothetical protein